MLATIAVGGIVMMALCAGAFILAHAAPRREEAHGTAALNAQGVPRLNPPAPPGPAPAGMVWVPGGYFWMGSTNPRFPDARPVHLVYAGGFWMDRLEVTNAKYAQFVKATDYVTLAERPPDPRNYPGIAPGALFAGSFVFTPPRHPVALDNPLRWWKYLKGADWRHPEGPLSNIEGKREYPVVQVAWPGAAAYCKWAGGRLPTEAEFEFAARGGLDRKLYPWGNDFRPGGKFMANSFQGHFPNHNSGADGYIGTAPAGAFPPNGYGLYDMAGNVWEWTG
ncbi:MAG: SUMF1/EgtB/PvdO family nonheme iron enzyme, partial [Gemmataceae bacterium]